MKIVGKRSLPGQTTFPGRGLGEPRLDFAASAWKARRSGILQRTNTGQWSRNRYTPKNPTRPPRIEGRAKGADRGVGEVGGGQMLGRGVRKKPYGRDSREGTRKKTRKENPR